MSPPTPESQRSTNGEDEATLAEQEEEAQLFYERLEQTGQLVDSDYDADLSALPPYVTHVRYTDGTIQRIGFSASPYGLR